MTELRVGPEEACERKRRDEREEEADAEDPRRVPVGLAGLHLLRIDAGRAAPCRPEESLRVPETPEEEAGNGGEEGGPDVELHRGIIADGLPESSTYHRETPLASRSGAGGPT